MSERMKTTLTVAILALVILAFDALGVIAFRALTAHYPKMHCTQESP